MPTRTNRSARAAGTRHETSIATYLAQQLQDDRIERRSLNGRNDRGDVAGVRAWGQRVVIECKSQARHSLAEWLDEAEVERGNDDALVGIIVFKRRGTTDPNEQYVLMSGASLIALLTGERPTT